MAKKNTKVSIERVCQTCAHFDKPSSMCKKTVEHTMALRYACERYQTPQEWAEEVEARKKELMQKNLLWGSPVFREVILRGKTLLSLRTIFLRMN